MSDPRFRYREKKLPPMRQPDTAGGNMMESVTETNRRRLEELAAQTAKPLVAAPSPAQNVPSIPNIPGLTPHRDFHKVGSLYVTVANQHLSGQDDDLNPGFATTIMGGYAKAIALQAQYVAAFPLVDPYLLRVSVVVHGGYYKETCVFDTSYINVVGLGMPIITQDPNIISPGTLTSVVTITADCEDIEFNGFRIINGQLSEGLPWQNALGLTVEEGNDGGDFESAIKLNNLILEGGGTQAYIQRRVCGRNIRSHSADNYAGVNTEASIVERFCVGNFPLGTIHPQSMWSQWYDCHFAGQTISTGEIIKRGKAFSAYALDFDLSTWIPNNETIGVLAPESDSFYCMTGVYFHNCEFEGWTENKGWAWEYHSCKGIQGMWINDAGAGGVHHLMQSNTDAPAEAYTWFTGGTEIDCNYLVFFSDVNVAAPTSRCIAWLRNMVHACPSLLLNRVAGVVGGTAMGATSFGAQGVLYGVQSSTALGFFLTPAGAVDTGILTNCSSGNTDSLSNTGGLPKLSMRQGYQNFR